MQLEAGSPKSEALARQGGAWPQIVSLYATGWGRQDGRQRGVAESGPLLTSDLSTAAPLSTFFL